MLGIEEPVVDNEGILVDGKSKVDTFEEEDNNEEEYMREEAEE